MSSSDQLKVWSPIELPDQLKMNRSNIKLKSIRWEFPLFKRTFSLVRVLKLSHISRHTILQQCSFSPHELLSASAKYIFLLFCHGLITQHCNSCVDGSCHFQSTSTIMYCAHILIIFITCMFTLLWLCTFQYLSGISSASI